ncbi:hypothetical protein [Miltoncostaea oceani]|uniref:hypothetical protein n=1 Tax=Miltoncostaea oceani TaxID=2843216 RepID=UPI001C3C65F9|nr:hypothetical protein [Miltoncostaea oceani]
MESAVTVAGCAALSAFLLFALSGFGCVTDTNDDRAYCDDGREQDQLFWGLLTVPLLSLAFVVVGVYLNRGEDKGRGLYTTIAVTASVVAPILVLNAVTN